MPGSVSCILHMPHQLEAWGMWSLVLTYPCEMYRHLHILSSIQIRALRVLNSFMKLHCCIRNKKQDPSEQLNTRTCQNCLQVDFESDIHKDRCRACC